VTENVKVALDSLCILSVSSKEKSLRDSSRYNFNFSFYLLRRYIPLNITHTSFNMYSYFVIIRASHYILCDFLQTYSYLTLPCFMKNLKDKFVLSFGKKISL
jgi:hypothetical protein